MLLLRLILILLICYIAISALKSLLKGGKSKLSTRQKSTAEGEEMVFDPQCHSYVPKSAGVSNVRAIFLQPGMRADLFIPLELARFFPAAPSKPPLDMTKTISPERASRATCEAISAAPAMTRARGSSKG